MLGLLYYVCYAFPFAYLFENESMCKCVILCGKHRSLSVCGTVIDKQDQTSSSRLRKLFRKEERWKGREREQPASPDYGPRGREVKVSQWSPDSTLTHFTAIFNLLIIGLKKTGKWHNINPILWQ